MEINQVYEKGFDKILFFKYRSIYKRIDLNDNLKDNNSCKKYIYMMRKNNTLLILDLRNNPG